MKFKKAMNLLLILLFFAALLVPLVTSDFQGGKISETENRYLASFPTFQEDDKFPKEELTTWLNDNIGGRSYALRAMNSVDYRLSGILPGNVYEGKDKWLYLITSDFAHDESFISASTPDDGETAPQNGSVTYSDLHNNLTRISDILALNGIPLVIASYPTKATIYSEYLPSSILPTWDPETYFSAASALSADASLHFVSPFQELLDAKENRLTYCKAKDSNHWNNYGAFIAYQALIAEVSEVLPDIKILTEHDFIIEDSEFVTEKPGGFYATERDYVYTPKENHAVSDKHFLFSLGFQTVDPWSSYNYYRNEDTSLPTAVIVGDSYTWMFMLDNLAQSFSELIFIHWTDLNNLDYLLASFEPDVLISATLGSAIVPILGYTPLQLSSISDLEFNHLPIQELSWGYCCVDYCNGALSSDMKLTLSASAPLCMLQGWALDPNAGTTASTVFVQVGDQYYTANYGISKQSVVDYFQNENYLNSGYTISLNTEDVIEAGEVTVHVISADGTYRYAPFTYQVEVLP